MLIQSVVPTDDLVTQAIAQLRELKLLDAYYTFKRFYDRLPFGVEAGHLEHISKYGRIVQELGRERELDFHTSLLESHYAKQPSGDTAYALAVLYTLRHPAGFPQTLQMLDAAIRQASGNLKFKARIFLADQYSRSDQYGLADTLIDQTEAPSDLYSQRLFTSWQATVCRHRTEYDRSDQINRKLLQSLSLSEDWFLYFHAHLALAKTQGLRGNRGGARKLFAKLSDTFSDRRFRGLRRELQDAEE